MVSFAFDWFRNIDGDPSVLRRNVAWCSHYFSQAGFEAESAEANLDRVARAANIFQSLNVSYNHYGWAYLYDRLDAFPLAQEFFLDSCRDDVVVGYEMSRAQCRVLEQAGKKYINLRAHPVRFLTDYLLAASTNDRDFHARLLSAAPPRSYLDQHVAFHKARAARRYQRRMDPDAGIVFFAQISFDASRIRNGEFLGDEFISLNLERYIDVQKPKNIYVKRHPHEKMKPSLLTTLKKMGGKEIETNTYDLMSVERLRLCALSSSVCHEAVYFGAVPTPFYTPPDVTPLVGEQAPVGDYIMTPANIFDRAFWSYILQDAPAPEFVYPMPLAPFRTASGLSWG